MSGLVDLYDRVRAFLDTRREEATAEFEGKRLWTVRVGSLDSIYYDQVNGAVGRGMGGTIVSAVAGQLSFVQLFNPANSGVDVVVEKVLIVSDTAVNFELRANTAALGVAVTTTGRRDFRSSRGQVPVLGGGTEAAASGSVRAVGGLVAQDALLIEPDVCLGPQNGLHVELRTVNIGLLVTFWWREYVPERRSRG